MPIIRDLLKKAILAVVEWFKEILERRKADQDKNAAAAETKAQESEARAASSQNSADVEKYKAVAEAWREAAEMYRNSSNALRDEIVELKAKAAQKAESSIDVMSDSLGRLNLTLDPNEPANKKQIGGTSGGIPSEKVKKT